MEQKRSKKDRRPSPKVGESYPSDNHGRFTIVAIEGYSNMTIMFEETGALKSGVYTHVVFNGKVRDPSRPRRNDVINRYPVGSVWPSNSYGDFEVISIKDSQDVTIRWVDTGSIQYNVTTAAIRKGGVVDPIRYQETFDYLKPERGSHYLYVAKLDNKIIYVGQGFGKRYLHCRSGRSHNYELNRLHFSGEDVKVEIHCDGMPKEHAVEMEKQMIHILKPYCNERKYNVDYGF